MKMKGATSSVWSVPSVVACAILSLALGGPEAWACSCALENEDQMLARATLAVTAQAVTDAPFDIWGRNPQTPLPPPRAVTIFRVDRILKGPAVGDRIAVLHDVDPGACGILFDPAKTYLLAFGAPRGDEPGPLRIGLCSVKAVPHE